MSQPDQDPMDKLKELKEKEEELKVMREIQKRQDSIDKIQAELNQSKIDSSDSIKELKERETELRAIREAQKKEEAILKLKEEISKADAQSKLITSKPDERGIIAFSEERYKKQLEELQKQKGFRARMAVASLKMFKFRVYSHNNMIRAKERANQISKAMESASKQMDEVGREMGKFGDFVSTPDSKTKSKSESKTGKKHKKSKRGKRGKQYTTAVKSNETDQDIGKRFENFFD